MINPIQRRLLLAEVVTENEGGRQDWKGKYLSLLAQHRVALKGIKSAKTKERTKAEYLPLYADFIGVLLEADAGGHDGITPWLMAWAIDAGDYETALKLGAYALRHSLPMPVEWKRDLPATLLENIVERIGREKDFSAASVETVKEADSLTADHDMPDEIRAKAWRLLGDMMAEADPIEALDYYNKALALVPTCGCKTAAEKLTKALEKAE